MKLLTGLLLSVFLFSSSILAQGAYLGPQVGIFKSKDSDESNLYGGAALRLKTSSSFALEGSIGYRQEKYADGAITIKNWPIMATAMFYPIPIVYGAAGAGWYNTTISYDTELLDLDISEEDNDVTEQEFGWHFGFGAELPLGNALLSGDVRYVFLDYDFKAIPGSGIENNFYVIDIGLLFSL